ncbi:MAG: hypothetical protein JSV91_00520 [Phycisphaerales bacterium]|nr:MAG: hypothetical protein JSV91_00520 [Phycisphaerales bacterium]
METPSPHAALIAALDASHSDAALERAFSELVSGADLPLLLAILRALVRQGVAGLAVRLLESTGGLLTDRPDLAALADELSQPPSGEIQWSELDERFRDNANAALSGNPHLHDTLDDLTHISERLHLFVTRSGTPSVVRDDGQGRLDFVLPFGDVRSRAAGLDLPETHKITGFVLRGVPSGPLLARLLDVRHRNGFAPPIDILETDPEVFGIWLRVLEHGSALGDPRLNLFVGPEATRQYHQWLATQLARGVGGVIITNDRPKWDPPILDRQFFADTRADQNKIKDESIEAQALLYHDRDMASWARRFKEAGESGPPLRALGFTTCFSTVIQHAMRDLASAFRRRGCEVDLVKEPNPSCLDVDTWTALARSPYDLVFVINHLRSELGNRIHPRLPYVCWCQDHMENMWTKEAGRSVGAYEIVLTQSPWFLETHCGYPADHLLATSNLTDPHTYDCVPVAEKDLARFRCDVSYVSHGSRTPEQVALDIAGHHREFASCLQRFLVLAKRHIDSYGFIAGFDLYRIMMQAENESGYGPLSPAQRGVGLCPHVLRLYDRLLRHETLEWAADWAKATGRRMRIFGRGWENHPRLREFAAGEIANGYELRCAYQASAINLQVNGYGSLHQRLLDCVASGGLVLSRYNPTDFLREPWSDLRRCVEGGGITSLDGLLSEAGRSQEVRGVVEKLAALGVPGLDPVRVARERDIELMRQVGVYPDEMLSAESYFKALAGMHGVPERAAGDISGFSQLTFHDRAELHQLMERYVDEPEARTTVMTRLRESVVTHDTYDVLAGRILDALATLFRRNSGKAAERD